MTTAVDAQKKGAPVITIEQREALDELAGRYESKNHASLDAFDLREIIKLEWSLYLSMLQAEGFASSAARVRRSVVMQVARQSGHKLTIEDARAAFGDLDPSLVGLITDDLEWLQRKGAPRKRRVSYRGFRPPRFKVRL